ncbi:MAG: isopentenyl phosphate kinase [Microgenomates group bacterium]
MHKRKKQTDSITLIKLGGSLITDKKKEFVLDEQMLEQLCQELAEVLPVCGPVILGHGAGSFGHVFAKEFQTHKGWIDERSREGVIQVSHAMRQLNYMVMSALIQSGLPVVSISPLSIFTARNHALDEVWVRSIEQALELGCIPVVHGDVIFDLGDGCTIFSTERVLEYISNEMGKSGWQFDTILHCGVSEGVLDATGKTIDFITPETVSSHLSALGKSAGIDVTGGMNHKVLESVKMAERGIPAQIINATKYGEVTAALKNSRHVGTKIVKEITV